MISIKDGDKPFTDSGKKECYCSRCLNIIGENEVSIKLWTVNLLEFRYCEKCDYDSDTIKEETENNQFKF